MTSGASFSTSTCFVCYQETDSPRSKIWLSDLNIRISLCSDLCLSKHLNAEKQFQNYKRLSKIVEKKTGNVVKYTQPLNIDDDVLILDL